jgi:hypothetical protein
MAVMREKKTSDQEIPVRGAPSWEELARIQGVHLESQLDRVTGGWPEDERDDGFEEAVARWRQEGLSSRCGG